MAKKQSKTLIHLDIQKNIKMKKDKIFLPYEITRSNIILKSLEKVFKNADTRSLPQFSVQNHPATLRSKKHLKIIVKIQNLIRKYKQKFNKKSKIFNFYRINYFNNFSFRAKKTSYTYL